VAATAVFTAAACVHQTLQADTLKIESGTAKEYMAHASKKEK